MERLKSGLYRSGLREYDFPPVGFFKWVFFIGILDGFFVFGAFVGPNYSTVLGGPFLASRNASDGGGCYAVFPVNLGSIHPAICSLLAAEFNLCSRGFVAGVVIGVLSIRSCQTFFSFQRLYG